MAAQSLASRSRRPAKGPDSEDIVLARAIEFTEWAKRHARIIIIVAVLAALAIGGGIWYRMSQMERRTSAAADLMVLEQSVAQVDPAAGAADLERFIARYDGTTYADEARIMLAQLRLQQGEPQQAIPVLEQASRRIGRSAIGAQAGLLLGAAHEQAGNPAAAVEAYERVARGAQFDFERRRALESAAALHETQGNFGAAADMYRQILDMTEEGSSERTLFEMRLAEAEQQARAQ
jgi:predicted negative regulator of RcsB-dependent stress response